MAILVDFKAETEPDDNEKIIIDKNIIGIDSETNEEKIFNIKVIDTLLENNLHRLMITTNCENIIISDSKEEILKLFNILEKASILSDNFITELCFFYVGISCIDGEITNCEY